MFKKFSSILSLLLFLIAVDEALLIFSFYFAPLGINVSDSQVATFICIVDVLAVIVFILLKRKNITLHVKATSIIRIIIGAFDSIFWSSCVVLAFSMFENDDTDVVVLVVLASLILAAFGVIQIVSGCLKLSRLKKEKRLLSAPSITQPITPIPTACPEIISDEPHTIVPENKNTFNGTTKLKRISAKQKKIIGGIVGVIAVAGIVIGIAHAKIRSDQEAQRQAVNEYNMYLDHLSQLYAETLSGASTSESVCVLTYNVWSDRIYEQYSDEETSKYVKNTADFNEAVDNLYEDDLIKEDLSSIRKSQHNAQSLMQKLQSAPSELSKCYDAALEMYTSFELLAELALQPTGNLNSYGDDEKNYVASYLESRKTLLAIMPVRKTISCSGTENEALLEDFYFANYLGQSMDKLPKTKGFNDNLINFGFVSGNATINGIKGKIYFDASSDMSRIIDSISWETSDYTETDVHKFASFLTDLYGKPSVKDGTYFWDMLDSHTSVLLQTEENLKIYWHYICSCE